MKLADLAFACYIYSHMTDYDSSYRRFVGGTRPRPDLQLENHQELLLTWLNEWGCRQFSKAYHYLAAREIAEWYKEADAQLFSIEKTLLSLTDNDFDLAKCVYAELVNRTACNRKHKNGRESCVTVGPTGTAKILFAIRPNAFVPWDEAIREELQLDGSAESYCNYLRLTKGYLEELLDDCNGHGLNLADLPTILNRPLSSLAKLMDEYFWVTVSRKCPSPTDSIITQWAIWR